MLDEYKKSSFMVLPKVISQTGEMLDFTAKCNQKIDSLIKNMEQSDNGK